MLSVVYQDSVILGSRSSSNIHFVQLNWQVVVGVQPL